MKFWVFVALLCISKSSADSYRSHKYYVPLIKDIHKIYRTAGIIVTHSTQSHTKLTRATIGYEISRMLSRDRISSIIVDFERLMKRLPFFTDIIVRPLIVVTFHEMEEVQIFEGIVKDLTMNFPVWLLLFTGEIGTEICEFCINPRRSTFNLRFDSQVLVLCCDSGIIHDWWPSPVNGTMIKEIGRWINGATEGNCFDSSTLYSRRNSLDGRELRVVAAKETVYLSEKDGEYSGIFGEILNEFSETMNFTITEFTWESGYGIWNSKTSQWSGVMGKIHRNEADIGISPLVMTNGRLSAVDFTVPMISGASRLYMRKLSRARVGWEAYVKALATDVWMVIIGLILAIPLFLTLIRYRRGNALLPQVFEHYLCVWGIFCQQGLSKFPDKMPLRIIYFSIFISAVVSASVYSASLVSFLAAFSSRSPFHTIEEFIADGTYNLILLKDSSKYNTYKASKDEFSKKMVALMKPYESLPKSMIDGFKQVCEENVAFETNEAVVKIIANSINCEITSIDMKTIETLGLITPKGSEYLSFINYRLRQFQFNGVFQRLMNKYVKDPLIYKKIYPKVHLEGVKPILYTLASGFFITLVVFIIELIFHLLQKKFRRWEKRRTGKKITYISSLRGEKSDMYFIL